MASGAPDIQPAFNPARGGMWFQDNPLTFGPSPWAGLQQTYRRFGLWRATWEWVDLEPAKFDVLYPLFAFYGSDRPFTIYDFRRPLPTGNATPAEMGALLVNGANQVGQSLIVDGAPANRTLFKANDIVGLTTGQAFRVKADCTSNGAGEATIQLCEYIRASPGNNTDVIVSFVPVRMKLDRAVAFESRRPILSSFRVEMTEFLT